LRPLLRTHLLLLTLTPACSCDYFCKFQFRPIHPPSRRLSPTARRLLPNHTMSPPPTACSPPSRPQPSRAPCYANRRPLPRALVGSSTQPRALLEPPPITACPASSRPQPAPHFYWSEADRTRTSQAEKRRRDYGTAVRSQASFMSPYLLV
jgi:hypothetical protein